MLRRDVPDQIVKRRGRCRSAQSRAIACSVADRWCAGPKQQMFAGYLSCEELASQGSKISLASEAAVNDQLPTLLLLVPTSKHLFTPCATPLMD
eukprot:364960-Chlamydomonas_euryale.AAC.3